MPESNTPEVFDIWEHRFTIKPEAPILPQLVALASEVVKLQAKHATGARVCAIVVEMERPQLLIGEE